MITISTSLNGLKLILQSNLSVNNFTKIVLLNNSPYGLSKATK